MGRSTQNEYRPDTVSAPGETLEEVLADREMSQVDLAARSGRPVKTINEIIKGKASITPETALQLERVLGVPASFWNNLERNYREHLARQEERSRLAKHVGWLKEIPVAAMVRFGWIDKRPDKIDQVRECLSFYGVASPDQWREVHANPQASFRRSTSFQNDPGAVSAWLRRGELEAASIECEPYGKSKFREALKDARSLTILPPEEFVPRLIGICAKAGVAVVFVKRPPKTPISGATRWLSPRKALIQLSLRYKANDHLWFTFFHEAGHILLHGKKAVFVEANGSEGPEEKEADRFAADLLIPPTEYRRIKDWEIYPRASVESFAKEIGVAAGSVVGRLQHDLLLPMTHLNDLKLRLKWAE